MQTDLTFTTPEVELQELRFQRQQLDVAIKALEFLERIRTVRPDHRPAAVKAGTRPEASK